MSNILDYIYWRGDITFEQSPFNEVDGLILSQISYCNFDNLIDSDFTKKGITLSDLYELYRTAPDWNKRSDFGAMINPLTNDLFRTAAGSRRFGNLKCCGYRNIINLEKDEQFAAITFCFEDGTNFIAYRGTDDTIVGWQEDFDLGWKETVPAQKDAKEYFEQAASSLRGPFRLGGHSKGANLVIYAAAKANDKAKKRILKVYPYDGPGFRKEFFESNEYLSVREKITVCKPQLSIVGMLFESDSNFISVECDGKGVFQHDPFNWHTSPLSFVALTDLDDESRLISKAINGWFSELNDEQKKLFVKTVFGILKDSDTRTNADLIANWKTTLPKMLKAMYELDEKTRDAVSNSLQLLFKTAFDTVKDSVYGKVSSKLESFYKDLTKEIRR